MRPRPYKSPRWRACPSGPLRRAIPVTYGCGRSWRMVAVAAGEMLCIQHELDGKLTGAKLVDRLTANLSTQVDGIVVERRFHHQVSLLAIDMQKTWPALAIRTTARGDDAGRQLHRPLHRLFHFGEATALVARG